MRPGLSRQSDDSATPLRHPTPPTRLRQLVSANSSPPIRERQPETAGHPIRGRLCVQGPLSQVMTHWIAAPTRSANLAGRVDSDTDVHKLVTLRTGGCVPHSGFATSLGIQVRRPPVFLLCTGIHVQPSQTPGDSTPDFQMAPPNAHADFLRHSLASRCLPPPEMSARVCPVLPAGSSVIPVGLASRPQWHSPVEGNAPAVDGLQPPLRSTQSSSRFFQLCTTSIRIRLPSRTMPRSAGDWPKSFGVSPEHDRTLVAF
jgi:hypothetical protein